MVLYDKNYLEQDYFGQPMKELMGFFESFRGRGALADLGAEQTRRRLQKWGMM
jgi:hypothetical protein